MMMVMDATRQLVSEGEGRARQEINNIERQVFGFINPPSLNLSVRRFTWLKCILQVSQLANTRCSELVKPLS